MTSIWAVQFWKDLVERGLRTSAQFVTFVLVANFVDDQTGTVNALQVDWRLILGVAGGGFLLSGLTSLGASTQSPRGTASFIAEVKYQPKTPIGPA